MPEVEKYIEISTPVMTGAEYVHFLNMFTCQLVSGKAKQIR